MLPNLLLHPLINWVMQRPAWFDSWELPTRKDVDWKLVVGSMLFGVGWGVSGLCPGPACMYFCLFWPKKNMQ